MWCVVNWIYKLWEFMIWVWDEMNMRSVLPWNDVHIVIENDELCWNVSCAHLYELIENGGKWNVNIEMWLCMRMWHDNMLVRKMCNSGAEPSR